MNVQIISFHCVLKTKLGQVISSTFNHDVITHAEGQKNMLSGLVEGLQNLKKGEKRRIALRADQAYGFYDPTKVIHRFREAIPQGQALRVGDQVVLRTTGEARRPFQVTQIVGDLVTLDGNHPLAGQDLVFEIEATDARDATPEEIWESSTPEVANRLH